MNKKKYTIAQILPALNTGGVERGVVEYEMSCTTTCSDIQTIEELRNLLEKVHISKCN